MRGLSDPATYGESGESSVGWYGTRRDLEPIEASPETDLAPPQIDADPE